MQDRHGKRWNGSKSIAVGNDITTAQIVSPVLPTVLSSLIVERKLFSFWISPSDMCATAWSMLPVRIAQKEVSDMKACHDTLDVLGCS